MLVFLIACSVALVVQARPASAHADLVSSTPTQGQTLDTAPASVQLVFSDPLNPSSVEVAVTDSAQQTSQVAPASVVDNTVTQPVAISRPDTYTVAFRVVSKDGHVVQGTVTFTVTTVATSSPSVSATASAAAPSPAPSSTGNATPEEGVTTESLPAGANVRPAPSGRAVVLWVVVAVVAVVCLGLFLWSRKRRHSGGPEQLAPSAEPPR